MARREISGSRAIVTGASSGIGRALAVELARQGASVVATARREDRLDELRATIESAGGTVVTVPGDVTDPATRRQLIKTARERFGGLDVLVNNAGVGAMGRFEEADPERLRRVMEVNFFAPVELIRLALPLLSQGTQPIIVNVSSILGLRATPYSSEYSASKFAMQGFSEALRTELIRNHVDVLVVSPGTTETEFFDSVLEKKGEPAWPEHTPVTPEAVAAATIRAMRKGRHAIIPYRWGRVFCWLNRLSPRLMDAIMARYS
ncbi:MAG: SDR family oxidoreductase [Pirellulales bacterium]|nr:SDR family oxidoreductase [Pirellulales bacterium]